MLAFVDESGDAGRKTESGSSRYFVVAVVTFEENDDANACDQRITALRTELRLASTYEFHFSKNSDWVKERFLEAVAPFAFSYHVFALNKDRRVLTGPGFGHKESLYKFTARMTFENAKPYLDSTTVILDRSGDRKFRDEIAVYLRRRINDREGPPRIKKVKIQRSDGNNLLQLADYVAGVSARFLNGKPDGEEWRQRYLATHRITERVWP